MQSCYYSYLINLHLDGTPKYPTTVTIWSSGASSEEFSDLMGIYSIMPNSMQNGKPVWKQNGNKDFFIFYSGKYTYINRLKSLKVGK